MTIPHPYRYPAAFRSQLERLERLSPGITYTKSLAMPDDMFFDIEGTGTTEDAMKKDSLRLSHIKRLIADWRIDGEMRYHAGPVDEIGIGASVGSLTYRKRSHIWNSTTIIA